MHRPSIPEDTQRNLFFEVGHRCAVCGESLSLQLAHIVQYAKSKSHDFENLIVLCANCHVKADSQKWSKKQFELHKKTPWVLRGKDGRGSEPKHYGMHNIPFGANAFFRGRKVEIDQIRKILPKRKETTESRIVVLVGQGGIGKTQTAIEIAWKMRRRYDAVFWIHADTEQILRSSLAALGRPWLLNIDEWDQGKEEKVIEAVLKKLKDSADILLIIDNVDNPIVLDLVMGLVAPALAGDLIVTSRLDTWPVTTKKVNLDVLEERHAIDFLLKRSMRPDSDRPHASYVARVLGCFPLALEQAAAWVAVTKNNWSVYVKRLKQDQKYMLSFQSGGGVNYKNTILTTWKINFDELGRSAKDALQGISFCNGDSIPEGLVELIIDTSNAGVDAICHELNQLCLIRRSAGFISVHRLTQFVIREGLSKIEVESNLLAVLMAITKYCPGDGVTKGDWLIWEQSLPHALTAIDLCEIHGYECEQRNQVTQNAAHFVQNRHSPRNALPLLELLERDPNVPPNSIESGRRKNSLGGCLWQIGREVMHSGRTGAANEYFIRGEKHSRDAVSIAEALNPPDVEFLALTLNNLGNVQRELNLLEDAEKCLRKAMDLEKAFRGESHPAVARRCNNLGQVLLKQSRFEEAELQFREALNISLASVGDNHPDLVVRYNALGELKKQVKLYSDALNYFRQSKELADRILPDDHPNRKRANQQWNDILKIVCDGAE